MSAYSEAEEIQVRLNIADEASLLDRYITELKDGSLQLRLTSSVLTFNHTFVNGHPRDMHIAFVAIATHIFLDPPLLRNAYFRLAFLLFGQNISHPSMLLLLSTNTMTNGHGTLPVNILI